MTKQTIISLMKIVPCVARAEKFLYSRGLVEYVEPNAGGALPTTLPELMKVALRKQKRFANEKEYRFVYLTGREPVGPFRLNIGDIRDIAFRMRTQDVYDRAEVNGRPL